MQIINRSNSIDMNKVFSPQDSKIGMLGEFFVKYPELAETKYLLKYFSIKAGADLIAHQPYVIEENFEAVPYSDTYNPDGQRIVCPQCDVPQGKYILALWQGEGGVLINSTNVQAPGTYIYAKGDVPNYFELKTDLTTNVVGFITESNELGSRKCKAAFFGWPVEITPEDV